MQQYQNYDANQWNHGQLNAQLYQPNMLNQPYNQIEIQDLLFEDWGRGLKRFDQSIKRGFKKTGKWLNTKAVKGYNDVMNTLEEED